MKTRLERAAEGHVSDERLSLNGPTGKQANKSFIAGWKACRAALNDALLTGTSVGPMLYYGDEEEPSK